MEKEFLKSRLETEQERCLAQLAELTPGSEEHSRLLYGLHSLSDWLKYDFLCADEGEGVPEHVIAPTPEPITPAPAEPADSEPAPTTGEPQMKKEDVRAALAEARMKGVDVSKLIADVGAANLSSVDSADYPKLMDALAKELEGK